MNDDKFAHEVRQILYAAAGKEVPLPAGKWHVETEFALPSGGRVDILITSGRHALGIETKVDDVEKLNQYTYYPKQLRTKFETCFCGLIKRSAPKSGRAASIESFLDEAADARVTWSELLAAPTLQNFSVLPELRRRLEALDPSLVNGPSRSHLPKLPLRRSIDLLGQTPETLVALFNDYLNEVADDVEAEPWQAGNAPIQMLIGKRSWAEFFRDGFSTRLGLSFDARGSSPCFDFVIILWNKTMCGGALDTKILDMAAHHFTGLGYAVHRNLPSKWHTTVQARKPFALKQPGLFFCNIFDQHNFKLSLEHAKELGWGETVKALATRARGLIKVLDAFTFTSGCRG